MANKKQSMGIVPMSKIAFIKNIFLERDDEWRGHFKKACLWGLGFHLLAVFLSDGFHRPDEHLGIMRFTGFKLGMLSVPEAFSSWEYPARIRPWLQPFLYTFFILPFKTLGLENPFWIAGLLRFFSSFFGFIGSMAIAFISYDFSKSHRVKKILLYSSFLLWFIPFFHARTSAENLGSSFFTFGLFLIFIGVKNKKLDILSSILIGSFFGLSFIFRYQMSVSIFFVCLWLLAIHRERILSLFIITLSFFTVFGISIGIDFWGYGEWVITSYNYVYENMILGRASGFGVDPWWKYLTKSLAKGIPPISFFYFAATFYYFIKRPKDIITWVVLPFLIIHSLIAHKELRFIFPVLMYLPLLSGPFLDRFSWISEKKWSFRILVGINAIALIIATVRPVYSPLSFYRFIYNSSEKIETVYTLNVVRDQLVFYQKEKLELIHLKKKEELDHLTKYWVLADRFNDRQFLEKNNHCKKRYSSYPIWLVNSFPNILKRSKVWTLFYCL